MLDYPDPLWPWTPFVIAAGLLSAFCLFRWARSLAMLILVICAYVLVAQLISGPPPP